MDFEQTDLTLTPDESLLWSGRADPMRLLLPRVQFLLFGLTSAVLGGIVTWMWASDPAPERIHTPVTGLLVSGGFYVGATVCLVHFGHQVRVAVSTRYYVTTRRVVCRPQGRSWGNRSEIPVADLKEWVVDTAPSRRRRGTVVLRRFAPDGDSDDSVVEFVGVEHAAELREVLSALRRGLIPAHARF